MHDANEGLKAVETQAQVDNILDQIAVYELRQALKFGDPHPGSSEE